MPITLNGDTGIVTPMYNGSITANAVTPSVNMKSRIINGAMVIDQRNAGSAVTSSGSYPVDRFYVNNSSDATFSAQQSTDVPTGQGFVNSLKVTYPTGDASIGATQYSNIQHNIEGFNVADLGFGGSGAKSVTLSFWVKASVAGQYSYAIYNSAESRINPQPFTINSANTWEFKSITYAGDTTGTWLTNNGKGLTVTLYTALGSNYLGSAGWNSSGIYGVTGQANAMASNGNIFAITGVQLEVGSTATSFDYVDYGRSLIQCQRYYCKSDRIQFFNPTPGSSQTYMWTNYPFPVNMRTDPTITVERPNDSTTGQIEIWGGTSVSVSSAVASTKGISFVVLSSGNSTSFLLFGKFYASAEL